MGNNDTRTTFVQSDDNDTSSQLLTHNPQETAFLD